MKKGRRGIGKREGAREEGKKRREKGAVAFQGPAEGPPQLTT